MATISGGAKIESQSFYSGKAGVGNMNSNVAVDKVAADWSNIKYVEFNYNASVAGTYRMAINYNGQGDKTILVKTNENNAQVIQIPQNENNSWDYMSNKVVNIDLKAGDNTIRVSGSLIDFNIWFNIDCIDICNSPIVITNGVERLEGENYNTTGKVETQSMCSNGKEVGSLNTNTAFDVIASDWSNVKYVDFTVYTEKAGTYDVTWAYNGNNADGMIAAYNVNKSSNQKITLNNKGNTWDKMNVVKFTVTLEAGFNDLLLSGTLADSNQWANIDKIELALVTPTPTDTATPTPIITPTHTSTATPTVTATVTPKPEVTDIQTSTPAASVNAGANNGTSNTGTLPKTGEESPVIFYAIGVLLILLGAFIAIRNSRKAFR